MENPGFTFAIILSCPPLRDGLLRELESSRRTSASSQRSPAIDGLIQFASRTFRRFARPATAARMVPVADGILSHAHINDLNGDVAA